MDARRSAPDPWLVLDNLSDIVFTTDARFATTFISASVREVLGREPEGALGTGLTDAVHPDDSHRFSALFTEIMTGHRTSQIEVRLRHGQTGAYLWFDAIGKAIENAHGTFAGNVVVLRDISARKRADTVLIEAEARHREIVDAATEVIFQTDLGGSWKLLSPSWALLSGYTVGESLGRPAVDFVHPDDREKLLALASHVIQPGESLTVLHSTRIRTKRGRTRWVKFSASPSRGATQGITGTVGTIHDVTSHHLRTALNDLALALDHDILEDGRRAAMLQRVSEGVAASMNYPLVWIALTQKNGQAPLVARAGDGLSGLEGSPESEWTTKAAMAGFTQVTTIPLGSPGAKLGVLCVAASEAEGLDDEQVSALESFASRLSLVLQLVDHHALLALQGAAMASSASALFITDAGGRIEWVNRTFERMSGYTQGEAVGQTPSILRSELQQPDVFQSMWAVVRAGRVWRGEIVNRRKNGESYVVSQIVTPMLDDNGVVTHLVAAHEDVTAHRQAETLIEHLAHHDALTDLPNRAQFVERLQVAMTRAEKEGERVGVVFLDLDRFKLVNDTLGHIVGDQLLREVAERLKGCVRDNDLIGRFGGDEFTIVLPTCDTIVATAVAERILNSLTHTLRISNHEISITGSIGIALSAPETRDAASLLMQADAAMYRAKEIGRNGYAFFSANLDARPVSGLSMQAGLRRALAREELTLHYQPQFRAADGAFVGVEALLRWTSPELGVVSPADFIPVAEQTGIVVDIDRWVLRAACAQAKAWQVAGIRVPRVAVNVSGVSFRRGQLLTWVKEALAATNLTPECLELELTEGIMMHDGPQAIDALADLRRLGIHVALDDFGTGYSSLSYLKRFKLDVLKIDRSFVTGLPDDPDSAAIARLIVAMAKTLRIETVAEGVETLGQATFLEAIGCHTLQGYLFSPGVAPDKIVRFAQQVARADWVGLFSGAAALISGQPAIVGCP